MTQSPSTTSCLSTCSWWNSRTKAREHWTQRSPTPSHPRWDLSQCVCVFLVPCSHLRLYMCTVFATIVCNHLQIHSSLSSCSLERTRHYLPSLNSVSPTSTNGSPPRAITVRASPLCSPTWWAVAGSATAGDCWWVGNSESLWLLVNSGFWKHTYRAFLRIVNSKQRSFSSTFPKRFWQTRLRFHSCFSRLEKVPDFLRCTVSWVPSAASPSTKRYTHYTQPCAHVQITPLPPICTQILDEVEERRAVSSSAVFTFLKAIQANPFPRPVSVFVYNYSKLWNCKLLRKIILKVGVLIWQGFLLINSHHVQLLYDVFSSSYREGVWKSEHLV